MSRVNCFVPPRGDTHASTPCWPALAAGDRDHAPCLLPLAELLQGLSSSAFCPPVSSCAHLSCLSLSQCTAKQHEGASLPSPARGAPMHHAMPMPTHSVRSFRTNPPPAGAIHEHPRLRSYSIQSSIQLLVKIYVFCSAVHLSSRRVDALFPLACPALVRSRHDQISHQHNQQGDVPLSRGSSHASEHGNGPQHLFRRRSARAFRSASESQPHSYGTLDNTKALLGEPYLYWELWLAVRAVHGLIPAPDPLPVPRARLSTPFHRISSLNPR